MSKERDTIPGRDSESNESVISCEGKPKVAFVCVHNSCRSQMAEALGRKLASDVFESYSAGTERKDHINPDAVRMMKELHGIDMEQGQYSKLITDIPVPDVIIFMGCNVSCPNVSGQYTENWGLEDPSGQSDEVFAAIIHKIQENILRLRNKLKDNRAEQYHDVINHYDKLVEENNDPVHDPNPLREYMDKWDGPAFLAELQLSPDKTVLEIGVGTGRIAIKTAPMCGTFVGIDISPKTVERARENLIEYHNVSLYCADFMEYRFTSLFDVIYSSLTFMHIKDKQTAICKIAGLLKNGGRFVLSIEKSQSKYIDMGSRKVMIYPDGPDEICLYMKAANIRLVKQFETEMAFIFVAEKQTR